MNHIKLTSAIALLSSTLLVTACSSHKPTPDTAYTPSQEPEAYTLQETVDITASDERMMEDDTSLALSEQKSEYVADPMIEPINDSDIETLPEIPQELIVATQTGTNDTDLANGEDTRPAKTLFLFGFDQKKLDDQAETLLREHGRFLASHPEMKISINGHADPQGDANYNQYLAKQRANYVADLLKQEGVTEAQMDVKSWGSDAPSVSATHNRDNRRVELIYDEEYLVNYQGE